VNQTFTATTILHYNSPNPEYANVPVFVHGFGGDFGTLSIELYKDKIVINGDDGMDPKTGKPKSICQYGQ